MLINMLQEDIDNGHRNDSRLNPLSRAINRIIGASYLAASIWYSQSFVHHFVSYCKIGSTYYRLPHNALKFLLDYDELKDVQPISFELVEISETNPDIFP